MLVPPPPPSSPLLPLLYYMFQKMCVYMQRKYFFSPLFTCVLSLCDAGTVKVSLRVDKWFNKEIQVAVLWVLNVNFEWIWMCAFFALCIWKSFIRDMRRIFSKVWNWMSINTHGSLYAVAFFVLRFFSPLLSLRSAYLLVNSLFTRNNTKLF